MTNGGGGAVLALMLAYFDSSRQARVERYRIAQEAKVAINREKQITERTRIDAEVAITREKEITQREATQWEAKVEITREQRLAFESLCNALKDSLRSGDISLENIREQFGGICQLMIEKDLMPEERTMLFGVLNDLLAQQKEISAGNMKALDTLRPEKYLPAAE